MGIKDLEDLKKLSMLRSQIDGVSVAEIMEPTFPAVSPDDRVMDALLKMRKTGYQDIPVVNDGTFVGMISYGTLLRKKNLPTDTKVKTVMHNLPILGEDSEITKIAEHMVANNSRQLPVLNGKKIIGLVSRRSLISIAGRMKSLKDIKAWEIMTTPVESLRDNAMLDEAIESMRRLDIRTIPVINSADKLVGIVGMKEIIDNFWKEDTKNLGEITKDEKTHVTIESVCKTHVETIDWNTTIDDVAALMEERRFSTLPVVDGQELVGIITEYDIIELMSSCRERDTLFVQISGLDENDKMYTDAMYADIKNEVTKISKIYRPESYTVHVSRYNEDSGTKKYSITGKMFINGTTVNAKVVEWDLVKANSELIKKISDQVIDKKEETVTLRKRKK